MTLRLHRSGWDGPDPRTAYELLRLRSAVFVLEQACAYLDLDRRDLEPGAEQVWLTEDGPRGVHVVACLRMLPEPDGAWRVGRVCTAAGARGRGLASLLLADALARHGRHRLVMSAQAHLAPFYRRFGFVPDGPLLLEDDIPHLPMARPAQGSRVRSSASAVLGPV